MPSLLPLAAQTEITNEETGLRCLIEYPIKTMNISIDDGRWQVDTGPIAFLDHEKAAYRVELTEVNGENVRVQSPRFWGENCDTPKT